MQSLTKFILFQDDVAIKMGKYSDKNMRIKHKRKSKLLRSSLSLYLQLFLRSTPVN